MGKPMKGQFDVKTTAEREEGGSFGEGGQVFQIFGGGSDPERCFIYFCILPVFYFFWFGLDHVKAEG